MLGIGYLQVEAIIAAMSGVQDREMIRRRFKYLQRMSYPPKSNTGRGRRAVLDLEQVLQVVMAVELMQVGATPTRAIRILRTNWDELRPALALGWLVSRKPTLSPLRTLLVMNAGAFEDAGKSEDPQEPVSQPFRPLPAVDMIIGLARQGSTTRVVVDPARLATHLIDYAGTDGAGVLADELDEAYAALWAASIAGTPDEWVAAAVGEDRLSRIEDAVAGMVVKTES